MRFISFFYFSLEINKIACPFFNKTLLDALVNHFDAQQSPRAILVLIIMQCSSADNLNSYTTNIFILQNIMVFI
jgi:hypothetical protein